MKKLSFLLALLLLTVSFSPGQTTTPIKRILILFEGSDVPSNIGRGDARELAMLLGHFDVTYQLKGLDAYAPGEINSYDLTFYVGYSKKYDPPERFMRDVYTTTRQVIWMNTGMERFGKQFDLEKKFGFR